MIIGIAHVNLLVPPGTIDQADAFYAKTLGFTRAPVPALQKDRIAWFDITPNGQQVHIAFGQNEPKSSRHPCFKLESPDALLELRERIYKHFEAGGDGAPKEADKPGEQNSGELFLVFVRLAGSQRGRELSEERYRRRTGLKNMQVNVERVKLTIR